MVNFLARVLVASGIAGRIWGVLRGVVFACTKEKHARPFLIALNL